MYWLNAQTIIIIALVCYLLGTLVGVYLARVSVYSAVIWLIVGGLVAFGSLFFAGKNWQNSKK